MSSRLPFLPFLLCAALLLALPACDSSGPGDPPEEPPAEDSLTISFALGDEAALLPGETVLLGVEGASLSAGSRVEGGLGDASFEAAVTDAGQLAFLVPVVSSGAHELSIAIGEREAQMRVEVAPYDDIQNPEESVATSLETSASNVRALLSEASDAQVSAYLEERLQALEEATAAFETLSEEEQAQVAYGLRALTTRTTAAVSGRATAGTTLQNECVEGALLVVREQLTLRLAATAAAVTLPVYVFTPVGGVIVAAALAKMTNLKTELDRLLDGFAEACFGPYERTLDEVSSGRAGRAGAGVYAPGAPAAQAAALQFEDGRRRTLSLQTTYGLDSAVRSEFQDLYNEYIAPVLEYFPDAWQSEINAYVEEYTETAVPEGLALQGTPEGIDGQIEATGDALTLTFSFASDQPPAEAQDFTFELVDPAYPGFPTAHEATLAPPMFEVAAESGSGQTGRPEETLADPIVVRVTGESGDPAPGVEVTWAVTGGGGSISPATSATDADGLARAQWTLGSEEGEQTAAARVRDADGGDIAGSPVSFSATAERTLVMAKVGGDEQTGAPGERLGDPLVVRVTDDQAQVVPGVTVEWTVAGGGGALSRTATTTDAGGRAQVEWTLGDTEGEAQRVRAAVRAGDGTVRDEVTFSAEAEASEGEIDIIGFWSVNSNSLSSFRNFFVQFESSRLNSWALEQIDGEGSGWCLRQGTQPMRKTGVNEYTVYGEDGPPDEDYSFTVAPGSEEDTVRLISDEGGDGDESVLTPATEAQKDEQTAGFPDCDLFF